MLRNPVYAGVVRWKDVERAGIHTPLVSRELFDRVQTVLDEHSSGGERSWKHDHYLKGTLGAFASLLGSHKGSWWTWREDV
jgi:hypothetical protein